MRKENPNAFFEPHRHIGYDSDHSAQWNVLEGRRKGLSYKKIWEELNALATVQKNNPHPHRVFSEAAKIAHDLAFEKKKGTK